MRRDRVITFHRVKIIAAPEGYDFLIGKTGQIQPGREPYASYQPIPVKLDQVVGDGQTYYMLPEHLEDISRPRAEVGDTVTIMGKVTHATDNHVLVSFSSSHQALGGVWVDREDASLVRRAKEGGEEA